MKYQRLLGFVALLALVAASACSSRGGGSFVPSAMPAAGDSQDPMESLYTPAMGYYPMTRAGAAQRVCGQDHAPRSDALHGVATDRSRSRHDRRRRYPERRRLQAVRHCRRVSPRPNQRRRPNRRHGGRVRLHRKRRRISPPTERPPGCRPARPQTAVFASSTKRVKPARCPPRTRIRTTTGAENKRWISTQSRPHAPSARSSWCKPTTISRTISRPARRLPRKRCTPTSSANSYGGGETTAFAASYSQPGHLMVASAGDNGGGLLDRRRPRGAVHPADGRLRRAERVWSRPVCAIRAAGAKRYGIRSRATRAVVRAARPAADAASS